MPTGRTICGTFLAGAFLALAPAARPDVTLASLFQEHAVLQCGQAVPVWGWADPGEAVTVRFGGQTHATVAAADGRWQVRLDPLPASVEPAELVATGKSTLRIGDVLVGEVWLCAGQSNMVFPVNPPKTVNFHLDHQEEETAAARHPRIRNFHVGPVVTERPAGKVAGHWAVCAPEVMHEFTAAGYFFAREIQGCLGVPVGIIESSWGGTPIEPWLSAEALAADPAFAMVAERWSRTLAEYPEKKAAYDVAQAAWLKAEGAAISAGPAAQAEFLKSNPRNYAPRGPGNPWTPAALYKGMIAPLVPYGLRGVLWYQGESNTERAGEYAALFTAMIGQWRRAWGQGDFPFYFVQIANYKATDRTGRQWAFLREAQSRALALPATGMVVTIDIGNPLNIHPGNKQEVGRRLARLALAQAYGQGGESSGPVFRAALTDGAALRVRFAHSEGLQARAGRLASFEVAGADRIFHPAEARVEGEDVLVASPEVLAPVAVRYAWSNNPESSLANRAGLPASPFRSDLW